MWPPPPTAASAFEIELPPPPPQDAASSASGATSRRRKRRLIGRIRLPVPNQPLTGGAKPSAYAVLDANSLRTPASQRLNTRVSLAASNRRRIDPATVRKG